MSARFRAALSYGSAVNSGSLGEDQDGWVTLARETLLDAVHLQVTRVEVRTPASEQSRRWIVVHRKRAVVIAAFTSEDKLLLIRQERIPIGRAIWEFPAGQVDDAAATADAALQEIALQELREETGYELRSTGEVIALGHFYSSPGFTDERAAFFLVRGVERSAAGNAPEASESILDCREVSAPELADMIRRNEIQDANTLSLCAMLVARGFLSLNT